MVDWHPAPWAQSTPDPISSASWSTWAEINSKEAQSLGIREGDVLLIRSTSGEIEALAYPHPGVRPGVIGVPIGQGHHRSGRWAEDRDLMCFPYSRERKIPRRVP
ncbi:MAG: hypothetical protein Ct9H300mP19_18690 [Dehalococcoidia bacterium]|nr:MAG: hypothetical protein Ct9H300mP19_18690 [Dehalococcoidia bacterium]